MPTPRLGGRLVLRGAAGLAVAELVVRWVAVPPALLPVDAACTNVARRVRCPTIRMSDPSPVTTRLEQKKLSRDRCVRLVRFVLHQRFVMVTSASWSLRNS